MTRPLSTEISCWEGAPRADSWGALNPQTAGVVLRSERDKVPFIASLKEGIRVAGRVHAHLQRTHLGGD